MRESENAPSNTTLTFLIASPGLSRAGMALPSRSSAGRNVDVYDVQKADWETCDSGAGTNVRCSLRSTKGNPEGESDREEKEAKG